MIKVKRTVRPYNLWILCAFVNVTLELGLLDANDAPALDLVVTSGTDGVHKSGSMHGNGWALDFRSKIFTLEEKQAIIAGLQRRLGPAYDAILEDLNGPNEHIHVERDPVRGGFDS